jgi:hypothetical protein
MIRRGRTDRPNPWFLVVSDDGEAPASAVLASVLPIFSSATKHHQLPIGHRGFGQRPDTCLQDSASGRRNPWRGNRRPPRSPPRAADLATARSPQPISCPAKTLIIVPGDAFPTHCPLRRCVPDALSTPAVRVALWIRWRSIRSLPEIAETCWYKSKMSLRFQRRTVYGRPVASRVDQKALSVAGRRGKGCSHFSPSPRTAVASTIRVWIDQ